MNEALYKMKGKEWESFKDCWKDFLNKYLDQDFRHYVSTANMQKIKRVVEEFYGS